MSKLQDFFATLDADKASALAIDKAGDIAVAIIVFGTFWVIWLMVNRTITPVFKRMGLDVTSEMFVRTLLKGAILVLGLSQALAAVGVDTSAIVASLGLVGITIGFAARDALSNVIAGLLIFWDRPFVIGDLVEVEGNYGKVERITLRSTRVVTVDGRMLAVPNTIIINSTVVSYTNFPHLRLDIDFTIGVNEDIQKVREIVLQAVREFDGLMKTPEPAMLVKSLNDFNVACVCQAWLDDEKSHVVQRAKLRETIFTVLRSNNIEMPFETLQIVANFPAPSNELLQ